MFSNRDVTRSADDGIFTDVTDLNVAYDPNTLTKHQKIALRRWAANDDEPATGFSDNMPALNSVDIESLNIDLNDKLRARAPLTKNISILAAYLCNVYNSEHKKTN